MLLVPKNLNLVISDEYLCFREDTIPVEKGYNKFDSTDESSYF